MRGGPSRRQLLAAIGGALGSASAGCLSLGSDPKGTRLGSLLIRNYEPVALYRRRGFGAGRASGDEQEESNSEE